MDLGKETKNLRNLRWTIIGTIVALLTYSFASLYKMKDASDEGVLGVTYKVTVNAIVPALVTLTIKPEKRVNEAQNLALQSSVEIRNAGTSTVVYQETVQSNNVGFATLSSNASNSITVGNYDVAIKGMSHLRRVYTNRNINTLNGSYLDLSNPTLIAGDSHPSSDNYINAMDISYEVQNLYSGDLRGDLNRDGLVNSLDFSILIGNLYKTGDQ